MLKLQIFAGLILFLGVVIANSGRELQAATRRGRLAQRSEPFLLKHEAILAWSDGRYTFSTTSNLRLM